jgi:WD40 repeat protein
MGELPPLPHFQAAPGDHPLATFLADLRSWTFRSQARAAAHFGLDRTTIWRYEEGRSLPQPAYIAALALLINQRLATQGDDPAPAQAWLLAEVNQALLTGYPEMPPFATWSELSRLGESFQARTRTQLAPPANGATTPSIDWGDAPELVSFYGRQAELADLQARLKPDRQRLLALLGVGGVGKTLLAVRLVALVAAQFDQVIWRSLVNAPPLERLLQDWLRQLYPAAPLPPRLDQLLPLLQARRCLLILDNFESLLAGDTEPGGYRAGYEDYGQLLQLFAESRHQSCLLLTSREQPRELALLATHLQSAHRVSRFHLPGLNAEAAGQLLAAAGLDPAASALPTLITRCSGNPKILQIVAASIRQFYAGSLNHFLAHETIILDEVRDIMHQQYARLSPAQREVLTWLALSRERLSLSELRSLLLNPQRRERLLATLSELQARALIETNQAGFFLQQAVAEFVLDQFLTQSYAELCSGHYDLLHQHALMRATAQNDVRASQVRVLLEPLAARLIETSGLQATANLLAQRVAEARQAYADRPSYLGGNLLNLLVQLGVPLAGWDFSHLALWQVYLPGVSLRQTSFAHCDLREAVFSETFGSVRSVAFSPDGQYLAAGASNGEIHLWRLGDRSHLLTLDGQCWIEAVSFSPDSQFLATAGIDAVIRLWDCASGVLRGQLVGHMAGVRTLAFHPNGTTLASGSEDATIRLWELAGGTCTRILQGHRGTIWSLALHPGGELLASAGNDLLLWDLASTEPPQNLSGHSAAVMSVAFSPDGTTLASGGFDATIQLWRIPEGTAIATLAGQQGAVRALAYSPDGSILASGGEDEAIHLWRTSTYQPQAFLSEPANRVRALAFSPDGLMLASGSHDQNVRLWDLKSGQCHSLFQGHINQLRCLALSPDGQSLAVGVAEQIHLLAADTGAHHSTLQGHSEWVQTLAFSPDGSLLASGSDDTSIRLWRLRDGAALAQLHGHHGWVQALAFSPDGCQILSSSADWSVRCWDVSSGRCLATLNFHNHHVWTLALSPDGRWLASGGADEQILLWDREAGSIANVLEGHQGAVWSLAFSADARQLVSGGQDGLIQIWDVYQGCLLSRLSAHHQRVVAVAVSPNGTRLVSGSDDRTVRLWDLTSGTCLHTMPGHSRAVVAVAFSPDGHKAISGSEDGSVRIWSVAAGTCLRQIHMPRPYDGLKLQGARGLTPAQRNSLLALGAWEAK